MRVRGVRDERDTKVKCTRARLQGNAIHSNKANRRRSHFTFRETFTHHERIRRCQDNFMPARSPIAG